MKEKSVDHSETYWMFSVAISISKEIFLIRFDLMLKRRWFEMIVRRSHSGKYEKKNKEIQIRLCCVSLWV